jgi:hypothetical protein
VGRVGKGTYSEVSRVGCQRAVKAGAWKVSSTTTQTDASRAPAALALDCWRCAARVGRFLICVRFRIKEYVFWRRFLWRLRKTVRKSYEKERAVAVAAVVSACRVASSVYQKLVAADTATKSDKSPVTIADFASQAIILAELAKAFPSDHVVAEETSAPLSEDTDASRKVRRS